MQAGLCGDFGGGLGFPAGLGLNFSGEGRGVGLVILVFLPVGFVVVDPSIVVGVFEF